MTSSSPPATVLASSPTTATSAAADELNRKQAILDIQKRDDIDDKLKGRLIQDIMSSSWKKRQLQKRTAAAAQQRDGCHRTLSGSSALSTSSIDTVSCPPRLAQRRRTENDPSSPTAATGEQEDEEEQEEVDWNFYEDDQFGKSFHDKDTKILGCKHYQKKCKIRAPCCGHLFTCRLCHDEAVTDHTIERTKIEEMLCMHCSELQPVGQNCRKCKLKMARYYCDVCKLFDDDETKNIYHCPHCNICRVGKGLGIDFFHCMTCHACMHISLRQHKCVERSLDSNCPICSDFLFTSTKPVMYLRCGHWMHASCFDRYTKTNYICPVCSKSLGDVSEYFRALDEFLALERLPAEFEHKKSNILCSDCEDKSVAKFHFQFHKCGKCGSYNTKVIS